MPILSFKKNRSNEIVLTFDKNELKQKFKKLFIKFLLKPLFYLISSISLSVEKITHKYLIFYPRVPSLASQFTLSLLMALGLGFGFSITVFSQPSGASAFPSIEVKANGGIEVRSLKINDLKIMVREKTDQINLNQNVAYHHPESAKIGDHTGVLLSLSGNYYPTIQNTKLGDKVQLTGKNNGIYNYTVVETRLIKKSEVHSLLVQNSETIIIYADTNILNDQTSVLIAR